MEFNDGGSGMKFEEDSGDEAGGADANANTLDTVSAKSFSSFVRPGSRMREDEMHKRLQRHQSFFNSHTEGHHASNGLERQQAIRRAESFNHNTKNVPSGICEYYMFAIYHRVFTN